MATKRQTTLETLKAQMEPKLQTVCGVLLPKAKTFEYRDGWSGRWCTMRDDTLEEGGTVKTWFKSLGIKVR